MGLDTKDPIEGIVQDRIDMGCHRIVSPQGKERPAVDIRICHQILIHKKALICVTAPDPFVPFDSINKENTAAQPKGVLRYRPNLVKQPVIAEKLCPHRNIYVLMDCFDPDLFFPAVGDVCIPHRGHLPVCGSGFQL